MEYLRKNVNMTCADQDQILEFYIKLRLAIAKGGIFIKPIEDISKQDTIAEDSPQLTNQDQDIQSNALFTLLSVNIYRLVTSEIFLFLNHVVINLWIDLLDFDLRPCMWIIVAVLQYIFCMYSAPHRTIRYHYPVRHYYDVSWYIMCLWSIVRYVGYVQP